MIGRREGRMNVRRKGRCEGEKDGKGESEREWGKVRRWKERKCERKREVETWE